MPRKKAAPQKTTQETQKRWLILGAVVFLAAGWIMGYYAGVNKANPYTLRPPHEKMIRDPFDFGNQTYMLNDQELPFVNGSFESADKIAGQHTAKIMTRGINGSRNRAAAILVDNPGGSGNFFYIVGAVKQHSKITYSKPQLLGDRIKIVSVSVEKKQDHNNGIITVTYLDRPENSSMSISPLEQKIKRYAFENDGDLIEVIN